MPYAIIAELPLGTYHGHAGDGEVDRVPSPARLASALLCAAAQGPRAEQEGDLLHPCGVDTAALRWLESHPPDGMLVPDLHANRPEGQAFRTRLLETRKQSRIFARTPQKLGSVAVAGGYAWTWRNGPPVSLREAIEALCADVSHLGMAETPVRVRVGTAEPTHDLAPDADWWDAKADDLDIEVAGQGRTDALMAAYLADNATVPKAAQDKLVTVEAHVRPTRVTAGVSQARYASRQPAPPRTPWGQVLLADTSSPLSGEGDRVRWAVAVHRALIRMIDYGAPPVLTGVYGPGVQRPANRCAIQVLGSEEAEKCGEAARSAIALMLPSDIDGQDQGVIYRAWRQLTEIHPGRLLRLSAHRERRADRFWLEPAAGRRRLWRTVPAVVPETRGHGRGWTLGDAASLSVGMVLRDQFGFPAGKGDRWYKDLAETARSRGLRVEEAVAVREGDLSRFIHKIPDGLPLRPYRALLDLADLAAPQCLLAVGQNRHLGNGLLVPQDVPLTSGGSE
jgi:CRISPR-associated protein Csb2